MNSLLLAIKEIEDKAFEDGYQIGKADARRECIALCIRVCNNAGDIDMALDAMRALQTQKG